MAIRPTSREKSGTGDRDPENWSCIGPRTVSLGQLIQWWNVQKWFKKTHTVHIWNARELEAIH